MFGSSFAEFDQRQEKPEPTPKLDFAPFRTPDAMQQNLNNLAQQQQQLAEEQRRQYQALQQLGQYPQNMGQALGGAGYYQQGSALAGEAYYGPNYPPADYLQQLDTNVSRQLLNNVMPAPISKPKPAPRVPELNLDNVREISLEEDP